MSFGSPNIATPRPDDARGWQTAISNTRQRIEQLEGALSTAQQTLAATGNTSTTNLNAILAQLANLRVRVTALENASATDIGEFIAGEDVVIGQGVVPIGASTVGAADASDPTRMWGLIGISLENASAGGMLQVQRRGIYVVPGASTLIPGRAVYVEGTGITQTPDSDATALPVGVAVTATTIFIDPDLPALLYASSPSAIEDSFEDYLPVTYRLLKTITPTVDLEAAIAALPFSSGVDPNANVPVSMGGVAVRVTAGDIARLAGGSVNLAALINALPVQSGIEARMQVPVTLDGVGVRVSASDFTYLVSLTVLLDMLSTQSGAERSMLVPVLFNGVTVLVSAGDIAALGGGGLTPIASGDVLANITGSPATPVGVTIHDLLASLPLQSGADATGYIPVLLGSVAVRMQIADILALVAMTLGTAATLNFTTDGTLSANSDALLPTEKAVKTYVDTAINSRSWKTEVRARTTAALAANTYNNGVSGVGATLTGNANGALAAQDGVTLVANDALLVMNEATPANAGIYVVTQVGTSLLPYILTRRTDADSGPELVAAVVPVSEGTLYANSLWEQSTAAPITVGTTNLVFVVTGGGGGGGPSGVNHQTGTSYTLVLADASVEEVEMDNAAANVVTVPLHSSVAFPAGASIAVRWLGAGQTSVVGASGVTVNTNTSLNLLGPGSLAVLTQSVTANVWWLTGELLPVPATSYKCLQRLDPANTTVAGTTVGIVISSTATVSHPTQLLTNLLTAIRRIRWATSASAGTATGFFETSPTKWQGNGAGLGGYSCEFVFGLNLVNTTGHQVFVGLGAAAVLAGDPSALVSCIGMGFDAADLSTGNWQLIRNDASGTATKVNLGSGAARNLTDLFKLTIAAAANGSAIFVTVINLSTAITVLSTSYSTDIPANNLLLAARVQCRNGAIASAVAIDLATMIIGMQE